MGEDGEPPKNSKRDEERAKTPSPAPRAYLPGDLEWSRALDSAGQQYCGVLPDSVRSKWDPEPGAAARAQLNQFLGLPDLLLCLEVKRCVTSRGQGWLSYHAAP